MRKQETQVMVPARVIVVPEQQDEDWGTYGPFMTLVLDLSSLDVGGAWQFKLVTPSPEGGEVMMAFEPPER